MQCHSVTKLCYLSTLLCLLAVPRAVPAFQVSSPSAETMLVTWEELPPRDRGGVITRYQLQYRPASTPSAVTTLYIDDPTLRSFLVPGQSAYTVQCDAIQCSRIWSKSVLCAALLAEWLRRPPRERKIWVRMPIVAGFFWDRVMPVT